MTFKSGAAGGDLAATFPNPTVAAIHETGGPTKLTFGSIPDGDYIVRSGTTLIGAASAPPSGAAGGDLTGTYPNPTLADTVVDTAELVNLAVTTAKINDLAVTTGKIADLAVTAAKIANTTITATQIANATITDTQVAAANKDGASGTASMRTLGTGAAQACAGNDSRLSDSRAPTGSAGGDLTGTYPNPTLADATVDTAELVALAVTAAKIANATITDTQVAAANKDGASGTASMRTLGTGAAQACAGNDSRLSDSRAPTGSAGGDLTGTYPNPTLADATVDTAELVALAVTAAKIANATITATQIANATITDVQVAAANKDGAAGTACMRTLSTTSTTACAGNDSRLSDSRAPNGSASGDLGGSYPSPTVAAIHETSGPTKLTIGTITDGEFLKRSGSTLISGSSTSTPTGAAGGDLGGTYPNPTVTAIHETSGPTQLVIGTITDGQFLKRSGGTLISAAGAGTVLPQTNGFRLTGVTATPVMTADSTSLSTIYLTPFKGGYIALYNGSSWDLISSAEVSLAVTGRTTDLPFDVFAYNNSGTVTLEFLDWTNATTRATALVRQDGIWSKTGALTRRWVGSCRARSSTTFHWVESGSDAPAKFDLFNADNRVRVPFSCIATTNSWNYKTTTWRQAQGSTNYQVDVMVGLQEEGFYANLLGSYSSNNAANYVNYVGIGFDSTTAFTGIVAGNGPTPAIFSGIMTAQASISNLPTIGRHFYAWLEIGNNGAGTTTWQGDNGALLLQSGMTGTWVC